MNLLVTNNGIVNSNEYFRTSFDAENTVYEVLRVVDGVALFLEDHYLRLLKSLELQHMNFHITFPDFKMNTNRLISVNNTTLGNIKFVCSLVDERIRWSFGFIPHSYPSNEDYTYGVSADLLFAERNNPNAKVIQSDLRNRAGQLIKSGNLYEVLLVNHAGFITEGSRSNVFFLKSGIFYTAPTSMVLVGITRLKVMNCIKNLNYQLKEVPVSYKDIANFDAAFLSGTSPKVLPIRFVGSHKFDTKSAFVRDLMYRYDSLIHDYIGINK